MRKFFFIVFLILVTALAGLFGYGFFEANELIVRRVDFAHPKIPPAFDGTTVAFLADIHCSRYFYFTRKKVRDLVEKVNRLKPDLILLGGDYVSGHRYIASSYAELKNLKAPLGVYGVLGNHDHWADAESSRREMKKSQIPLLENSAVWIKKGGAEIRLGGVGDWWEGTQDLKATMRNTKKNDFVLLLSHNPDYLETLPKEGPDLVLCGHTHGGQVTMFGLWAPCVSSRYGEKYRSGRKEIKSGTAFISNGIGTVVLPIRFFAPPEILLITLKNPHTP